MEMGSITYLASNITPDFEVIRQEKGSRDFRKADECHFSLVYAMNIYSLHQINLALSKI